jgi:hypothetical protein
MHFPRATDHSALWSVESLFGQPTAPLAITDPMPAASYSARGGARIGGVNYTWPLASLSVDRSRLRIVTTFFGLFETGQYSFRPDQVARIDRFGRLGFTLSAGDLSSSGS